MTESGAAPRPPRSRRNPSQIAIALAVTVVLVFGSWLIGGRQGFDAIGRSGMNAKLLPRVGEVAPDLQAWTLVEGEGEGTVEPRLVALSDYAGQPIWLNFWGSWCQPCRAEMPELIAAYAQLEGSGMVMLAISLDEPIEDAYLYAVRNQANFMILSDHNRSLTGQNYQISNFPTHIFIDATGIVRSVQLAPLSVESALAAADAALNPPIT